MTPSMQGHVTSMVMEIIDCLPALTESFEPFAPEARPGDRLLDRYADCISFDDHTPGVNQKPYLDELIVKARADPLMVLAVDRPVPHSSSRQAALAAIIYKGHTELDRTRYVSGKVTMPNAELNAIAAAIHSAIRQADCHHIMVFTDSLGSARWAVDPSVHSGQAHSLSVCHVLTYAGIFMEPSTIM
ncbi:hypothetical protein NLJ89_g12193 [Agrocybe chaxingu]|uniref:RNase H type-1 domain-containing protein n=1 Tax=Agrocybe chaxingu TaxID=84603 RepID=A0A9W8MMD1_9AGAR|nr:hypothetical protein NLJ89_g12193 [Agrocybe chaxingu]